MPKKKQRESNEPTTLQEAILYFADEDACVEYVASRRWPDGVVCPHCGATKVYYLKSQRRWKCSRNHKRRQFTAKVGTIFEDSPLPFSKWLPAVWMVANCKNGISSYEIHRALNVTQKTAWFMLQRIRRAMQGGTFEKIDGEVEVDETYVGGKARFMHKGKKAKKIKGRGTAGKAVVMGLLARHGEDKHSTIIASVIAQPTRETLQGKIRDHVEPGSEVHTDEHSGYDGLDSEYQHMVINHGEAYVKGTVTTNRIENFWSLLKRGIKGTYVSVEPFHLFRYVDEQAFRFNHRKDERGDGGRFSTVMGQVEGKRLTYRKLIAEPQPTTLALAPA